MNSTNELDLNEFFYHLREEVYCLIKKSPEFPRYYPGSDADIFCYDLAKVSRVILRAADRYIKKNWQVLVTDKESGSQVYIDFFNNGELDFRFDLYQSLPKYKNITVKQGLFGSVIEGAKATKKLRYNGKPFPIFVPSQTDDLLLRYVEYIEWYQERPDKIKHLDYILKHSTNRERIKLLDKLHFYTSLPQDVHKHAKRNPVGHIVMFIKRLVRERI